MVRRSCDKVCNTTSASLTGRTFGRSPSFCPWRSTPSGSPPRCLKVQNNQRSPHCATRFTAASQPSVHECPGGVLSSPLNLETKPRDVRGQPSRSIIKLVKLKVCEWRLESSDHPALQAWKKREEKRDFTRGSDSINTSHQDRWPSYYLDFSTVASVLFLLLTICNTSSFMVCGLLLEKLWTPISSPQSESVMSSHLPKMLGPPCPQNSQNAAAPAQSRCCSCWGRRLWRHWSVEK